MKNMKMNPQLSQNQVEVIESYLEAYSPQSSILLWNWLLIKIISKIKQFFELTWFPRVMSINWKYSFKIYSSLKLFAQIKYILLKSIQVKYKHKKN